MIPCALLLRSVLVLGVSHASRDLAVLHVDASLKILEQRLPQNVVSHATGSKHVKRMTREDGGESVASEHDNGGTQAAFQRTTIPNDMLDLLESNPAHPVNSLKQAMDGLIKAINRCNEKRTAPPSVDGVIGKSADVAPSFLAQLLMENEDWQKILQLPYTRRLQSEWAQKLIQYINVADPPKKYTDAGDWLQPIGILAQEVIKLDHRPSYLSTLIPEVLDPTGTWKFNDDEMYFIIKTRNQPEALMSVIKKGRNTLLKISLTLSGRSALINDPSPSASAYHGGRAVIKPFKEMRWADGSVAKYSEEMHPAQALGQLLDVD